MGQRTEHSALLPDEIRAGLGQKPLPADPNPLGIIGDLFMIKIIISSLALMLLSPYCYAENSNQLCTAGGYYSGAQDHFMSGLAVHILSQRNQLSTPECGALWREAVEVGEHFSKTGKAARPSDARVIAEATNFSSKVYDGITKLSGL